ncbi:hypothetical protein K458DRAFT_426847 [Lentithecium fluviatile CBS 122367]|uniref:SNF2 family helicase/ATPase-like protein n=1 Tax=Lentithecium fluviatile CBS 122367 TaxID=1168545 RepID=A0A6G1JHS8_9PLEO|nr:hypothetical protein K458DRAFT_426847 [Lentithecium fluviatile CBS 122367]
MSSSPRKRRAPFRLVDTISSPQKPNFATPSSPDNDEEASYLLESESGYSVESFRGDRSETDFPANSSSLFDENRSLIQLDTPPSTFHPRHTTVHNNDNSLRVNKMVREREPPMAAPPTHPPAPKSLQELASNAPEFGHASPLRNPLKKDGQRDSYSNVFNVPKPGQSRPEFHRDPVRMPSEYSSNAHGPGGRGHQRVFSQQGARPYQNPAAVPSHPFQAGPPQVGSRYSNASSTASDVFEIPASQFQPRQPYQGVPVPRPMNPPAHNIPPAPRPMYSSVGHVNGFQPVNQTYQNPFHGSRKTIILDDATPKLSADGDEDDFDPDVEIRAHGQEFGAPDMYAYVDSSKANENIKELLEGAFDDDNEKIPRTRGRKKKQQQEDDTKTSLAQRLQALEVKEEAKDASAEDEEDDDGTVEGMKVKLLPHQVDGVSWMIEKETGAHNKRGKLPKGGMLADDMGLGKTIQSIALILSNPRPGKGVEPENKKNKILPTVGKGTLIVAPLALIKQWEAEIKDKVAKSYSLSVLVHHGPSRTKSVDKLKSYDVVITTYQVLSSEHGSCGEGPNGSKKGCFGVHWYRTILDEAHSIKNRNAKMSKACYEINSHYRWCLTGTPMQNNLDELQSLIRFLRIQPYCEYPSWKDSIAGPIKNGRGNLGMKRLQVFLKAFMKRRTKDVLKKDGALNFGGKSKDGGEKGGFQIVERNIETVIGEFTAMERAFYDRLQTRAEDRLEEMMGGEKQDYIGALVLLLRLRQACNHPNLTKSNVKDDKDALATGSKRAAVPNGLQTPRKSNDADADDLADLLGGLSVQTKRCDICQIALNRDNAATGAIRCNECEANLNASAKKAKKAKKHRKHKHKDSKEKKHKKSKKVEGENAAAPKASRQRRVVVDSDGEDEGEWLVPESDRGTTDLGKAGGTDDENAEGSGDTLASVDSDSFATDDKDSVGSFIVHDTDSEDDGPVIRKKQLKPKVINLDSDDPASDSEVDSDESDSETDSQYDSESEESDIEYDASDLTPSTKIRQLLTILEKETPDHKVIVFSQFTSMLDLIQPFLNRAGYNFTRYDGSMRNDLREASLHKLRNDKRTRVLLCSLRCGSLGLNLTAASRVVIMEPFWNPFVEEQAIDRVHRLNQTVDVTVYRLSIHDSVEEKILALQESKRKLANAAIEGGKAMGKLSMNDILNLFKRDAEYDYRHADDDEDRVLFSKARVLDSQSRGEERGESTEKRRKAGSLGLKKKEDSIWGRR